MPLVTEVRRNGEQVEMVWDAVTLGCMYTVAIGEAVPNVKVNDDYTYGKALREGKFVDVDTLPIYYLPWKAPLIQTGRQTVKRDHVFELHVDGEPVRKVEFRAGDELRARREMKR